MMFNVFAGGAKQVETSSLRILCACAGFHKSLTIRKFLVKHGRCFASTAAKLRHLDFLEVRTRAQAKVGRECFAATFNFKDL